MERIDGFPLNSNQFWPQFSPANPGAFSDLSPKTLAIWLFENMRGPWAVYRERIDAFRDNYYVYVECGDDRAALSAKYGERLHFTPSTPYDLEQIAIARRVLRPHRQRFVDWEQEICGTGKDEEFGTYTTDLKTGRLRLEIKDPEKARLLATHPRWRKYWKQESEGIFTAKEYPKPRVRKIPASFAAYLGVDQKGAASEVMHRAAHVVHLGAVRPVGEAPAQPHQHDGIRPAA
jgi:hypothetical protein